MHCRPASSRTSTGLPAASSEDSGLQGIKVLSTYVCCAFREVTLCRQHPRRSITFTVHRRKNASRRAYFCKASRLQWTQCRDVTLRPVAVRLRSLSVVLSCGLCLPLESSASVKDSALAVTLLQSHRREPHLPICSRPDREPRAER